MGNNIKKTYKYVSLTVFVVAMLALTAIAVPFIDSVKEPEKFKAFINQFGAFGIVIMFVIQVAQIIVALIPGEVVEFMAGCMYGWLGGLLLCLAGVAVGQTLIFKLVKSLGKDFVEAAAGSKAMDKLKFLSDDKKLKLIIFFLFFIPGTPKDMITYIVPFTKIKLRDFIVLTLFARIPSIVSSTYAGEALVENDYKTLIIAYGVIIIVSLVGIGVYKLYEKKVDKNLRK